PNLTATASWAAPSPLVSNSPTSRWPSPTTSSNNTPATKRSSGSSAGNSRMGSPDTIRIALDRLMVLPEAEWCAFAGLLKPRGFRRGDCLTREGQVERRLYFLETGVTRHYFLRDGKEFTVDFHFPGDFVTAYYSFLTHEPSEVSIVCLEDAMTQSI